ncbi:hypothetical protein ABIF33_002287 [Bradyrhizobium elkanii]|uniref:hypothetical protein n=1 Tax=Bradyrhizobium elkanii TaxID=29448 RepID=UPI0035111A7D
MPSVYAQGFADADRLAARVGEADVVEIARRKGQRRRRRGARDIRGGQQFADIAECPLAERMLTPVGERDLFVGRRREGGHDATRIHS